MPCGITLKQLNQNAVALYPLVLPDRIELVLVSANQAPIRRTSIVDKKDLNRVIGQLRYALESGDRDAVTPAQQLYDWLIRPIENDLAQAGAETIIYAPDAQLRYIPLATLHDGEEWLAQNYRVQNITAASLADLNTETFARRYSRLGRSLYRRRTSNCCGRSQRALCGVGLRRS